MGRNRVHSAKPLDSNRISKGFFLKGAMPVCRDHQICIEIIRMDTSSDKTFSCFWKKSRWADCFDIGLASPKKLKCQMHSESAFFFLAVAYSRWCVWLEWLSQALNSLKVSFTTPEASCGEREIWTCKLFWTFAMTFSGASTKDWPSIWQPVHRRCEGHPQKMELQPHPKMLHLNMPLKGKKMILVIWVFPKIGVPPNHPYKNRVFHYKPSILGEPPLFLETPILGYLPNLPVKHHF